VTTAATLLAVSFFAFATGTVSFLQMFGIGCGLAILIDATLVRGVLVPAAMRVPARAAWYAGATAQIARADQPRRGMRSARPCHRPGRADPTRAAGSSSPKVHKATRTQRRQLTLSA